MTSLCDTKAATADSSIAKDMGIHIAECKVETDVILHKVSAELKEAAKCEPATNSYCTLQQVHVHVQVAESAPLQLQKVHVQVAESAHYKLCMYCALCQ